MMHLLRALICALLVASAAPSFALEPCGEPVVDTAGVLTDISGVRAAAADLAAATGAEVRVRIAPDYAPSANLDLHVRYIRTEVCESWNNLAGEPRSNMIILFVTTNRQTGLYYGDQWAPELRQSWPMTIERMKPALRDGDYDRAMVLGLQRIEDIIVKVDAPAAPTVLTPAAPQVVERVIEREPVDLKPFAQVLVVGLLLLGFIFGLRRVYTVYTEHRRAEGLRFTAQQRAVEAFAAIGTLSLDVDKAHNQVVAALSAATKSATITQLDAWQERIQVFYRTAERLNVQFNAVADPRRDGLTHEEYGASQEVLEKLRHDYQSVTNQLTDLADQVTRATALAASLPAEYDAVRNLVPTVGQVMHTMGSQGFVVTAPEAMFREGETLIESARRAIDTLEWEEAAAALVAARTRLADSVKAAEALPARRQKAQGDLDALRVQVGSFPSLAEHARATMVTMVSAYTKECYRIVAGNGTEAERLYATLSGKMIAIKQKLQAQDWDSVQTELVAVAEIWEDIEDLLEAIVHRQEHLDQMVKDATAEYREAQESISAAEAYLKAHPSFATTERKQALKDMKQSLGEVERLMKVQPLPVVDLFRQLSSVDDAADAALQGTQAAVQEEAARIERAARLVRDIEGRLGDHKRYFKNHRSDISQATTKALDEVEARFDTLRRERSIATTLTLGAQLEAALDEVDRAAKTAVHKAEAKRQEERREEEEADRRRRQNDDDDRRRSQASSVSNDNNRPSSTTDFGGGSSTVGTGSSEFGGGSSSW